MKKIYDIAVKVSEYTNRDGETKGKWTNVGAVIQGDDGPFMLVDPHFNFAAVDRKGKDTVICSLFKPESREDKPKPAARAPEPPEDDIPFS